jgi:hypothetical protein
MVLVFRHVVVAVAGRFFIGRMAVLTFIVFFYKSKAFGTSMIDAEITDFRSETLATFIRAEVLAHISAFII